MKKLIMERKRFNYETEVEMMDHISRMLDDGWLHENDFKLRYEVVEDGIVYKYGAVFYRWADRRCELGEQEK